MQSHPVNWDEIRSHYPLVANKIYFNTASLGAMSKETIDAQHEVLRKLHEEGANLFPEAQAAAEKLRNDFLTLTDADEHQAAIIPDVSTAMNQLVENLADYKKVAVLEGDFPSMTMPWLDRDFSLSWIKKSVEGYQLEAIQKVLEDGVDILSMSWVIYNSGQMMDIEAIARLCKATDTIFILDVTQGLGVNPLSLKDIPVDVVVCSCFKWFLSGYGIGMIIATNDFVRKQPFLLAGQSAVKDIEVSVLDPDNIHSGIRRMELGHIKHQQVLALAQSFGELASIGFEAIQERVAYLMGLLVSQFERHHIKVLTPTPRSNNIIMIEATPDRLAKLEKSQISCTNRNGVIRFSPYFYNNERDIEQLIDGLK